MLEPTLKLRAQRCLERAKSQPINQVVLGSTSQLISPSRAKRFADDPGVDWGKILNGYNYVDALNGKGAFAGSTPLTLASRYGMSQVFQGARVIRLAVRFTF